MKCSLATRLSNTKWGSFQTDRETSIPSIVSADDAGDQVVYRLLLCNLAIFLRIKSLEANKVGFNVLVTIKWDKDDSLMIFMSMPVYQ